MRRALVVFILLAFLLQFTQSETTPPPPPTPEPTPVRISVDFPNEEIRTVLRNVADLFELNLVVPETLHGRTSIKLRNVTWRQIFREVLYPNGYTFIEDDNIIRVVSQKTLDECRDDQARKMQRRQSGSGARFGPLLLLAIIPFVVVRVILSFAILLDTPPGSARFFPQWLWAILAFLGGVLPLLAYWLMHHSALVVPPVLSAGPPPTRGSSQG